MIPLPIRRNRHGELAPPLHPHVSGHRSYRIAIRTARRRFEKTIVPMAVVTWHNENFLVMPAWMAKAYDEEDLPVEFI